MHRLYYMMPYLLLVKTDNANEFWMHVKLGLSPGNRQEPLAFLITVWHWYQQECPNESSAPGKQMAGL